jgi:lipopolysaccharide biosynthesis glycosyltransferase
VLHVACSSDVRFAPDCAVMLASLTATNPAVTVHFLQDASLKKSDVEVLETIVTRAGGAFNLVEVVGDRAVGLTRSERFPVQAWYRVLLPELLPELDRVLYLDADTLITGPLVPLWEIDLDGCLVAAVTNPLLASMLPRIQRDLGLPDLGSYFNSGVLLIDLEAWRAGATAQAVLDFARAHESVIWPDQDALNAVLHARRLHLHPRWNAMPGLWNVSQSYLPHTPAEVREAVLDPAIVHFVGPHKPWHYRNRHPYRAQYFSYLDHTPWRGRRIEGRTPWQALLRPLPWLWAYHIEVTTARLRTRLGSVSHPLTRSRPGRDDR